MTLSCVWRHEPFEIADGFARDAARLAKRGLWAGEAFCSDECVWAYKEERSERQQQVKVRDG